VFDHIDSRFEAQRESFAELGQPLPRRSGSSFAPSD
jgi:hypothetical protein